MRKEGNNFAFIDSQNVNLGVRSQGWRLDFEKFRIYLREHYGVRRAFLFLGYVVENKKMYQALKCVGYELIFKEIVRDQRGNIKGNCDAELVLHAVARIPQYARAVIITGDGDMACVVRYLAKINKFEMLLVPNEYRYSILLKKVALGRIRSLTRLKEHLSQK